MEHLPFEDRVVRSFIRDGRLVSIPSRQKKREVILRYLLDRCFPEDRAYPEPEVNQRLALYHPDDGHIAPADLTMALRKGARAGGAEVYEQTAVTAAARTPSGTYRPV